MKKAFSLAGLIALLVLTGALLTLSKPNFAAAPSKPSDAFQVSIDNFSFSPGALTIPVGTKVTWTNKDDVPHTVVSNDKLFGSPVLDTDQQFSYTFTKPGTYGYYCSIHPKMTAKVVVQ